MINRNSFRIVSLGNDQQRLTPDDLMVEVIVSRPSTDQGNDAPLNWRERRMVALLGDQGRNRFKESAEGFLRLNLLPRKAWEEPSNWKVRPTSGSGRGRCL